MTLYIVAPALFLVAVLQASAVPHLKLWGVFPDLPLLIVVSWSLLRGVRAGFTWGLIAGIFLDLFSGLPAGSATVGLAAVGCLSGLAGRSALRARLLLPLASAFLATAAYDLILLLGLRMSGRTVQWGETVVRVVLPSAALNLLVLPLIYVCLRALHRRSSDAEAGW